GLGALVDSFECGLKRGDAGGGAVDLPINNLTRLSFIKRGLAFDNEARVFLDEVIALKAKLIAVCGEFACAHMYGAGGEVHDVCPCS
ncbi:hypothetical protein, partial [Actinotignum timonense]|uniref:hypothetical protein n=1 Tax=Actinotignum timonense TaxID=1870995 RepID=UPI002A81399C